MDFRDFKHLRKWVTVGTPFIHAKSDPGNRRFVMNVIELSVVILLPFIALCSPWLGDIEKVVVAVSAAVLAGWFGERGRERKRASELFNAAGGAWSVFRDRWAPIYSKHDEAINGLVSALGYSGRVVPRATLRSPAETPAVKLRKWYRLDQPRRDGLSRLPEVLVFTVLYCVHRIADMVVSPWVDNYVLGRLRIAVFGADVIGWEVAAVCTSPVDCGDTHKPIEEAIGFDVSAAVSAKAPAVAHEARRVLWSIAVGGIGAIKPEDCDKAFELLIHNEYFSIPRIREHIRDSL